MTALSTEERPKPTCISEYSSLKRKTGRAPTRPAKSSVVLFFYPDFEVSASFWINPFTVLDDIRTIDIVSRLLLICTRRYHLYSHLLFFWLPGSSLLIKTPVLGYRGYPFSMTEGHGRLRTNLKRRLKCLQVRCKCTQNLTKSKFS